MWALFLALVCVFASVQAAPQVNGTMTGDMYVFAYSWTPEYCYGQSTWPGCTNTRKYWGDHFTLHGLWPQYTSGGYPASCTTEVYDPASAKAVGMNTMTEYWPDVEYAINDPQYTSFWNHEWSKHGTCTGLSQEAYFQAGIDLIKKFGTPSIVTSAVDSGTANPTLAASDLRNAFGGATKVALQCESGKYLSGAYTCWSAVNGLPSAQITCPSDVQKEDTCTSSSVIVETFAKQKHLAEEIKTMW